MGGLGASSRENQSENSDRALKSLRSWSCIARAENKKTSSQHTISPPLLLGI